jgi:hypothetical protein
MDGDVIWQNSIDLVNGLDGSGSWDVKMRDIKSGMDSCIVRPQPTSSIEI